MDHSARTDSSTFTFAELISFVVLGDKRLYLLETCENVEGHFNEFNISPFQYPVIGLKTKQKQIYPNYLSFDPSEAKIFIRELLGTYLNQSRLYSSDH